MQTITTLVPGVYKCLRAHIPTLGSWIVFVEKGHEIYVYDDSFQTDRETVYLNPHVDYIGDGILELVEELNLPVLCRPPPNIGNGFKCFQYLEDANDEMPSSWDQMSWLAKNAIDDHIKQEEDYGPVVPELVRIRSTGTL